MKHWVFDLDGTLVDSFPRYFESLREIFAQRQAVFSPDLHHSALTESLETFFARHLGASEVPSALHQLQIQSNQDATQIRPFEGFLTALEELARQGSRIGVWTNRDLTSAQLILKHSGLEEFVEICVSGTCVSQRKPHPEGLLRIMHHFGCDADLVTMVGDHEYDVLGAKTAGTRAVRASWHGHGPVEVCARADFQFQGVAEFLRWMRER